jgi:hypothetical protein
MYTQYQVETVRLCTSEKQNTKSKSDLRSLIPIATQEVYSGQTPTLEGHYIDLMKQRDWICHRVLLVEEETAEIENETFIPSLQILVSLKVDPGFQQLLEVMTTDSSLPLRGKSIPPS